MEWYVLQRSIYEEGALEQLREDDEEAFDWMQAVLMDAAKQLNLDIKGVGMEACYETLLSLGRKGFIEIEVNTKGDYRLHAKNDLLTVPREP